MSDSKYFFKPHIGKNHKGRLVLLATTGCCHSNCPHYRQCTTGNQEEWSDCLYPDTDENDQNVLLSDTVPHMVKKFINDSFDGLRIFGITLFAQSCVNILSDALLINNIKIEILLKPNMMILENQILLTNFFN